MSTFTHLADVQRQPPPVNISIDCVGIMGLRIPLKLPSGSVATAETLATADIGVELSATQKGTHMSRLVEILDQWREMPDIDAMRRLLDTLAIKLDTRRAWVRLKFPYPVRKQGPCGDSEACMVYDCSFTGCLDKNEYRYCQAMETPVMTVCPCSRAICAEGAHSQRAIVTIKVEIDRFLDYEFLAAISESSASSPVYTLLKRKDEKLVTENAFSRPLFVEDVARLAAEKLRSNNNISAFMVKVESMESIHNHNAFASIASENWRGVPHL